MQATLETLVTDLNDSRKSILIPELEAGLNEQQRLAFHHDQGPCLVLAGAGSGKTTVLTRRIARLLAEGVEPQRIFVATFTKKAADEMSLRLAGLLGEAGPAMVEKLWIGTFHSHCLRILKTEWAILHGKAGYFQIADEHWQLRVARAIIGDKEWLPSGAPTPPFGMKLRYDPKSALSAVSAVKNRGAQPEDAERAFREHNPTYTDDTVAKLVKFWKYYEQAKQAKFDVLARRASKRLDFDDLLIEALHLLQTNPVALDKYREQFQAILIDETQDTSAIQWEIARLLTGSRENIFIVGDIGQAIYSFRGADPAATIVQYNGAFPTGEIIRLPKNYRSSATIVRAANELIEQAGIDDRYRLQMDSSHGEGTALEPTEHQTADDEASWIAQTLRARQDQGGLLHDCAILMRTNAYSRSLEDALIKAGVPYKLEGAMGFYGRREVRDLLAFLHLSLERNSPQADEACKRVLNVPSTSFGKPTRFLGGSFIGQVETVAAKRQVPIYQVLKEGQFTTKQGLAVKDFRDMLKEISQAGPTAEARLRKARDLGYDEFLLREEGHHEEEGNSRLDNLEELCVASAAFPSAQDYLNFTLAQQHKAGEEPVGDFVEMMTIHRAKGLEWPVVFVTGFAFGMLPHHRSLRFFDEDKTQVIPESIEEERRLAYVALTRAKDHLYLTWPKQTPTRGLSRSPFLLEMPSLGEVVIVEPVVVVANEPDDEIEFDETLIYGSEVA